ncbi:MAG: hypothetical protein E7545_08400 [Ruminococcaceae bacterium]|nr:hypothetical protein [Oscillospiraceae bacterium]
MKKLNKVLAFVLVVLIFTVGVNAYTVFQSVGQNPAAYNVCSFGAVANDGKDDTAAFVAMGQKQKAIYIPAGEFEITQTIELLDSSLIGCGAEKSVIICKTETDREPIIEAGGRCVIRDITIRYDDSCITGKELAGERVGIYTGQMEKTLKRGTSITNVKIENVGTGVYSPLSDIDKFKMEAVSFSVTYESVSVTDFTYRGFDMANETRTGNIYRNIYISTNGKEANAGFYLQKLETECDITNLTVENSKLKTPVRFAYSEALTASSINFIDVELTKDNTAFLYVEHSNVLLGSLNFYNCAPVGKLQSFVRLGDNMYRGYAFDCLGNLHVENFNIYSNDVKVEPNSEQCLIMRKPGYVNTFDVMIDRLYVEAPEALKAQYSQAKINGRDINLVVGQKIG